MSERYDIYYDIYKDVINFWDRYISVYNSCDLEDPKENPAYKMILPEYNLVKNEFPSNDIHSGFLYFIVILLYLNKLMIEYPKTEFKNSILILLKKNGIIPLIQDDDIIDTYAVINKYIFRIDKDYQDQLKYMETEIKGYIEYLKIDTIYILNETKFVNYIHSLVKNKLKGPTLSEEDFNNFRKGPIETETKNEFYDIINRGPRYILTENGFYDIVKNKKCITFDEFIDSINIKDYDTENKKLYYSVYVFTEGNYNNKIYNGIVKILKDYELFCPYLIIHLLRRFNVGKYSNGNIESYSNWYKRESTKDDSKIFNDFTDDDKKNVQYLIDIATKNPDLIKTVAQDGGKYKNNINISDFVNDANMLLNSMLNNVKNMNQIDIESYYPVKLSDKIMHGGMYNAKSDNEIEMFFNQLLKIIKTIENKYNVVLSDEDKEFFNKIKDDLLKHSKKYDELINKLQILTTVKEIYQGSEKTYEDVNIGKLLDKDKILNKLKESITEYKKCLRDQEYLKNAKCTELTMMYKDFATAVFKEHASDSELINI